MIDLTGKTVLITGGSRGIGKGVAEGFCRAGACVHILADDTAVHQTAQELSDAFGSQVTGHYCDVTDADGVIAAMVAIGPIDILINNAGLERMTPLNCREEEGGNLSVADTFRRILDVNVTGTYLVTRAALPAMPDGGVIINTSSIWGKTAPADFAAYAASKHAVIGLTRSWSKELGPLGIRVNAVCPGWVDTEPARMSLGRIAEKEARCEEDVLSDIQSAQAMTGLMQPGDVAGVYVFLASPLASSVTGQSVVVDRGEVQG